jgi:hypothetical protein
MNAVEPTPFTSASATDAHVRGVRLCCLAVLALLALGVWAHLAYLLIEHRRLEPWKIIGFWAGDTAAFVWFARFAFAHALLGEPLTQISVSVGHKRFTLFALGLGLAMLLDLAFTLNLMHDEREGYARGLVAEAQILNVKESKRPEATWYDIDCRFGDHAGAIHEAHLRVEAENHEFPAALPEEAARALGEPGQQNKAIRIRYDPKHPARAWIDGLGWRDDNALYWFSLLTLFFQAAVTALFLLLLNTHSAVGVWPWWWESYKTIPLVVQAFWMLALGLIDQLMD